MAAVCEGVPYLVGKLASRFLKSWSGLTRSAHNALLYLPGKNGGPDFSRRSLAAATKLLVSEDDNDRQLNSLQQLGKQGYMSHCSSPEGVKIWAKALKGELDEHLKFALNSAVDTLPHNANILLWKKRNDDLCPCVVRGRL